MEPTVDRVHQRVALTGVISESEDGASAQRICQVDLETGELQVLTAGRNVGHLPRYAPDGRRIAYLSDQHAAGDAQLYLIDPDTGEVHKAPSVDGWVEGLQWSANGKLILLRVAGHGADVAGVDGATTTAAKEDVLPSWMPQLSGETQSYEWRGAWIYEVATDSMRKVIGEGTNVWEAVWAGEDAIAVVASASPEEGAWYAAQLQVFDIRSGKGRTLYVPQYQLGWPSVSPSGHCIAVVEALSSDRWFVAGDLVLLDAQTAACTRVDTEGVDVTYTEWLSDGELLVVGHRGPQTVIGTLQLSSRTFKETWNSTDITTGGYYAHVAGIALHGDCVLVAEGFFRAPELGVLRQGVYRTVRSFALDAKHEPDDLAGAAVVQWDSADGSTVEGWLLQPRGRSPFPLVVLVHGGPVWQWRPMWLGRRGFHVLMLLRRGFAIFLPNPRGSAGRGQAWVREVLGDMGGADGQDILSGVDALIERGLADENRLGISGVSYGGFMTAWLTTQTHRFSTAVAVCPHTNHVTYHLLSNIPQFLPLFHGDHYSNAAGKYYERNPVLHAYRSRTPTLTICGALDRCTPPADAIQFHNALHECGVESQLVNYPEEGHSIRSYPAVFDCAARIVQWLEAHITTAGVLE